jgi:hypothetical protein
MGKFVASGIDRMRDELMTEALCWQFESKVTAEYAYAANTTFELACYCPHEACLVRVHAKKRVNTYFYAPEKHVAGCPNEARTTEPSLYPGAPKPRTADEPAKPTPNLLGPGPTIKRKSVAPTKAELLQLAAAVRTLPARHPGTLEEVIDAWTRMTPSERALQPLTIGDMDLTYETAFAFLGNAADDIDSLNARERIIFGAATVVEKPHCFLIQSRKKFLHGTGTLPLLLVPKKRNLVLDYLPTLIDQRATLFWHGVVPELADKRNAFRFEVDSGSPYAGIALRLGELAP